MRLRDLEKLLRTLDLDESPSRRPPHEDVRAVVHALGVGLEDADFSLDCIAAELEAIDARSATRPAPPLLSLDDRGISVRMFYWTPGRYAPPHEHTSWTVSAVFHNRLDVRTYDWDVARRARRLEPCRLFRAERGQAGHIFEPCIHSPGNPTAGFSASIHIFNQYDRPRLQAEAGPIPGLATVDEADFECDDEERDRWLTQSRLFMLAQMVPQFRARRRRAAVLLSAIARAGDDEVNDLTERLRHRLLAR